MKSLTYWKRLINKASKNSWWMLTADIFSPFKLLFCNLVCNSVKHCAFENEVPFPNVWNSENLLYWCGVVFLKVEVEQSIKSWSGEVIFKVEVERSFYKFKWRGLFKSWSEKLKWSGLFKSWTAHLRHSVPVLQKWGYLDLIVSCSLCMLAN